MTPAMPTAIRQFIEAAIVSGDMALPFHSNRANSEGTSA